MTLVFDAPAAILAPTTTGGLFPVRRIFCIGRNYAAHAREMGNDPDREPPIFFTKWADAVVPDGSEIAYPPRTADYHYEAELVIAIGRGGRDIDPGDAARHIWGYAAGLDMTRRDRQSEAREKGLPWDAAKNVEQSAPLGAIMPAGTDGKPPRGAIALTQNGVLRQCADLAEMIWPVEDIVAHISRFHRIEAGDLIYTGTPAGVGPVLPGDALHVTIAGLPPLSIRIGPPARG